MAQTWLNGYFFEFDDSLLLDNKTTGVQYHVLEDLATEPVTLDFFKKHAVIDFTVDDEIAVSYIKAARQKLERYCQKSFGDKRIKMTALTLRKRQLLMYGPVIDIATPLDTFTLIGDYITSNEVKKNVTIEYNVGWGTGGLPETIKIAICQTAAGLYAFRENIITQQKYAGYEDQAKKSLNQFRTGYFL